MNLNLEKLGYLVIVFSLALLIVITFVKVNIDSQSMLLCEAISANPNLTMKDCPAHSSSTPWLLISAFGIGFLMLGMGIYMVLNSKLPLKELKKAPKQKFKEVNTSRFKKIDTAQLSNEEKKVYEFIKNKGGSAYQTDLIKWTGYSKVKITRILDKMETEGIVERKRRGMANLVVLK